jgi:hypothetical protein
MEPFGFTPNVKSPNPVTASLTGFTQAAQRLGARNHRVFDRVIKRQAPITAREIVQEVLPQRSRATPINDTLQTPINDRLKYRLYANEARVYRAKAGYIRAITANPYLNVSQKKQILENNVGLRGTLLEDMDVFSTGVKPHITPTLPLNKTETPGKPLLAGFSPLLLLVVIGGFLLWKGGS